MHLAAARNHIKQVKFLLSCGSRAYTMRRFGAEKLSPAMVRKYKLALHYAELRYTPAERARFRNYSDIAKMLDAYAREKAKLN